MLTSASPATASPATRWAREDPVLLEDLFENIVVMIDNGW